MGRIVEGNANVQGSPEWHELRSKSLGATCASVIMGCNPWKKPIDLYEEMVLGKVTPINDAMRRGMELEEYARRWCEYKLECPLFPVVMKHQFLDYMHASFDGLSMDESVAVEIKCPGVATHKIAKDGNIPDYYKWQLWHQMEIGSLDFAYYCSYRSDDDAVIIRLDRDDVMIEEMLLKEKIFYRDHIIARTPPGTVKAPINELDEDSKLSVELNLLNRVEIVAKIKHLEEIKAYLDEQIIDACKGESREIGIHKITQYEVKGSVDYSSIPELNGVDLQKYRKASRMQWRIS